MNLFNKLKEVFHSEAPTEKEAETAVNQPTKTKENYLENKNEALNIICGHLSRYSYSNDKNLAILKLWVITPETDSQVSWADSNFVKELKARLHQEMIEAVKSIEIKSVTLAELKSIVKRDSTIKQMVKNRLYYKTCAASERNAVHPEDAPMAWLMCIGGQEFVRDLVVCLNPELKNTWNIGRCERPDVSVTNDIVIKDTCNDISRQQAAIVIDDRKYYVKCKQGGCRARGGRVTKIIRTNGSQDELVSLSHRALPCLNEGDIVQLSKTVSLQFTFVNPEDSKQL